MWNLRHLCQIVPGAPFDPLNPKARRLHQQTALAMQRRLHLQGFQVVILPMEV